MRMLSFILTFAFVLTGPSVAGLADAGLPGIGTFAYNGAPALSPVAKAIVVAGR